MPFYELGTNGCWTLTQRVDIRHLPAKGRFWKKVRFQVLATFGYAEKELPNRYVLPDPDRCPQIPRGGPGDPRIKSPPMTIVDAHNPSRGPEDGNSTDLASVPGFLWGVVASYGLHTLPAIVHDALCVWAANRPTAREKLTARAEADRIFLCAMKETAVPWAKRWVMWAAVRLGGLWTHSKSRLFALIIVLALGLWMWLSLLNEWEMSVGLNVSIGLLVPLVVAAFSEWARVGLILVGALLPIGIASAAAFGALLVLWVPSAILWMIQQWYASLFGSNKNRPRFYASVRAVTIMLGPVLVLAIPTPAWPSPRMEWVVGIGLPVMIIVLILVLGGRIPDIRVEPFPSPSPTRKLV